MHLAISTFSFRLRRGIFVACCWVAIGFVAGGVNRAAAEMADRSKPMNIEADSGRYDDLKQAGSFSGNVVVTKGTMSIQAGQIDVRRSPEGYQSGVAIAAAGRLATFRQKRDGAEETIEGEAKRIEYDERSNVVRFVNHAVVRRYRGKTVADETTGNLITYDGTSEVFSVSGGSSAASAPGGNPGGRVRAVLAPRAESPASAASAPAAEPAASQ